MDKVKTLEQVRKYIDKEYWEAGTKSGYKDGVVCNWWWVNRWLQCFTQTIDIYDKKVLDLGCAMGGFVAGLLTWGADAYGIDISDYAIRKGKEELSYLKNRIFQGSCHDLSIWPSEFFDVIYSNQVFEHIPEQHVDDLVKEIYRVCSRGSLLWFALQMPTSGHDVRGAEDIDETHITLYPPQWWDEKFKRAGFIAAPDIDMALRRTCTGFDHYSFFKEYGWTTLVYKKV